MPFTNGFPFRRLLVDHMTRGQTRVFWELESTFQDPAPHTYQLQFSHAGIANAADWEDIGVPAENAVYLTDDEVHETGKLLHGAYRVILTTPRGTYTSVPVLYWGQLLENDWLQAREIIRKERLRAGLVAREGYLLKRIRYGARCSRCLDWDSEEVTNSNCNECHGTGFKVGYHAPVSFICLDIGLQTINEKLDTQERGTVRDNAVVSARALGYPPLAKMDVFVEKHTDQRYFIDTIAQKAAMRGVPLICDVELKLVPQSDPVYAIEVGGEPPEREELIVPTAGTGSVTVDHDYGGSDNLSYTTAAGDPILGAIILAFSAADYSSTLTAQDALAASSTVANGRWAYALKLDPGEYILRYEKVGQYGPDVQSLSIPE